MYVESSPLNDSLREAFKPAFDPCKDLVEGTGTDVLRQASVERVLGEHLQEANESKLLHEDVGGFEVLI